VGDGGGGGENSKAEVAGEKVVLRWLVTSGLERDQRARRPLCQGTPVSGAGGDRMRGWGTQWGEPDADGGGDFLVVEAVRFI
jgi:hypothetical protein